MTTLAIIALIFVALAGLSSYLDDPKKKTNWHSITPYLTLGWELSAITVLVWLIW